MKVCYIDEAGCTGALPSATSSIQPVFVIAAMAIDQENIAPFTHDFLSIKARFFPKLALQARRKFDLLLMETKGADLRRQILSTSRNERRHAIGFLDQVITLIEGHQAKLFGRVWIKGIAQPLDGTAVYTSSVQSICRCFQNHLEQVNDHGIVIADSRNKPKNAIVSHSIFTQKFKASGDEYSRLMEMPTFGHSENHVGLQVCDLICSALLFPIAGAAYCDGSVSSIHVNAKYGVLRERYGQRLMRLQHRFSTLGQARGGFIVSDAIGGKSGAFLFSDRPKSAPKVTITVAGNTLTETPAVPLPTITVPIEAPTSDT
ncbi:MAG TPA: DUF3800 domain-containing protein [Tepidisphaeraceae bacterium]|jgi:hypothetical protein|nr:DUF3800 domain-containing protein [Tepidisphaeraceae bacterium]